MDHMTARDRDFETDLESGETTSEEDLSQVPVLGAIKQARTFLGKIRSGFVEGSTKNEERVSLSGNVPESNGISHEKVIMVDNQILECKETVDRVEKTPVKEKRKKTSNKKPSKPPRPPRGPSLDAADQKLIKEISELAMLKRARIERMKTLKKMKAAKSSHKGSSMVATVMTILFCLVIIFQGMSSGKSSQVGFQGSPVSGGPAEGGLISVQYYPFPSASEPNEPDSGSPNFVEQIAGSDRSEKLTRVEE